MTAAALATAYSHGPGKWIENGPVPQPQPVPGQRISLAVLAAQGAFAAAVARLLVDVASPARWEPWNQYNDHRAYPSPRAAYLVDLEIVTERGRWPVDAVRRATIGRVAPLRDQVRLEFVVHRERLSAGYGDFGDALVELEAGHLAGALVEHAPRAGLIATADSDGVTLRPGLPTTTGPLPPRSSGIGPRGLSADPRPLAYRDLRTLIDAITAAPPGTLTHRGLLHRVAVRHVKDIEDGWYPLSLEPENTGPAMDEVQRSYGHPPSTVDVAGMNVALVTTADIVGEIAASGAGAYRDLLRAAGACAQHVCAAAARIGMFCRPVRSVNELALEAAAGVPLPHSVLYVQLAGRPRVACFPYDLTPLGAS